ncbi:uncharacterized protein EAE98_001422 [Botrytis deweyae]|uniref:Uncharacterized protein n=1 Tax=Botrytis deweyae TaxID=2478750 RepID=A0ABQ7IY02_9HELO|nr:uncharacterized protein EAE98_001422 [Botrytis deweyae]KAF7937108.1 hypothetical protein EAE98_001422 [Botrytis deweyae]
MSINNVPGIDAAGLRRYINLDIPFGNPALIVPAAAAAAPFPADLAPLAAGPLPNAAAAAPFPADLAPLAAAPLPALPANPLPAGDNAPAVVAAPVVEQPVPSWPRNPKPITGGHQPLTVWPETSNKDPTLNYVEGKYDFVRGGDDVVGSRAWLQKLHPGAREGAAWFLVSLLGRNGWTNNRVIVDAYTRMFTTCVKKFEGVVAGSDGYVEQWTSAEALIRQTLSKTQYNDLFIKEDDAGIVGDEERQGECLWRLRQPEDPAKPDSKKGKRGPRTRVDDDGDDDGDGDGDGPAGDPNSAHEKRDGGPEDQPAAKKRKGPLTGG